MRILTCLGTEHNLLLVLVAAMMCVTGSAITLRLFQRLRKSSSEGRKAWGFLCAVASGATIWCTHFVAMTAYEPGVPVTYAPLLTGLSLVVAILGSALAFFIAAAPSRWAPPVGGLVFGLGVAAMHYTGMAAFAADAAVSWSTGYVAASLVAAASLSAFAFSRAVVSRRDLDVPALQGVGLMVLGIVALHFTGMAAIIITPFSPVDGAMTSDGAKIVLAMAAVGAGLLVIGTGIASYALDTQAQAQSKARLDELIEGSVDGMVVEQDGRILAANAAFADLVGAVHEALIGAPLARWIGAASDLSPGVLRQLSLTSATGGEIPIEIAVRRHGRPGEDEMMIYAVRDLRARLAQERRIAHLARNDSLTGLANRASFLEFLAARTAAEDARLALLAIDLDRFKEVNDIHGHAAGDQLLVRIAQRMGETLRPGEFIARLGGDEFVAITPVQTREEALGFAERLREAIISPVDLGHAEVACGASMGVAVWPDDAKTITALINDADLAMYRAKASLATDVCFYEEEMDEAVRHRRRLVQSIREALAGDIFTLHYQVQVSTESGEITGYEALLRWPQANGSFISPADFIPLAEESGLILPIGEWVLRHACAEAASWTAPHKIAVNLSPVQLANVDLPRLVHQILLDTGLSPARLELEITETAMISDMDRTTHVLRQLKALGVTIAMDDFGTGYSSLSTLRAFPFDKIKLDRSFMTEGDGGPQTQAIIRAVLALGESLGIPVLAEGVETVEQLLFLRDQGCQEVQGYFLGKPQAGQQPEILGRAREVWPRAGGGLRRPA